MVHDLPWESLPVARKSLIPGRGFFRQRRGVTSDRDLESAEVIVIADPDADGLTAAAVVREVHGNAVLAPTEPHNLIDALDGIARHVEAPSAIYILDLCPDAFDPIAEAIATFVDVADEVAWFDHHEWDPTVADAIAETGIKLEVGTSDEVCTADVTLANVDADLADQWTELVRVVRDHDLWLRQDPRSDDLADYAHWADPEEFMMTIAEHGANLPERVQIYLEERRVEKRQLIEAAIDRAEYRTLAGYTVGLTYGRCSQNEVAEAMRDAGADVAVVIKPSGGISLRGSDSFERCHEIAHLLEGGGHPRAAGCKPPIYEDLLDYAHHWTTRGATARHAVLAAFRIVLADELEE